MKQFNLFKQNKHDPQTSLEKSIRTHFQDILTANEITLYQNIRNIDLSKSDLVSDLGLMILKLFKPHIKILNYYSEEVTLS